MAEHLEGSIGDVFPVRDPGARENPCDERTGVFPEISRACSEFLAAAGPMAVLAYLNARTRFRFTGIYRADPPILRNIHLYDRENPSLNLSGDESLLEETYCGIVCADDRPFGTSNAAIERRLADHVARERVLSYFGVPIRGDSGVVWGTLCHFDERPRLLSRSEASVLEEVAAVLASRLPEMAVTP